MAHFLIRALVGIVLATALWIIVAHDVRVARRAEDETSSDS